MNIAIVMFKIQLQALNVIQLYALGVGMEWGSNMWLDCAQLAIMRHEVSQSITHILNFEISMISLRHNSYIDL